MKIGFVGYSARSGVWQRAAIPLLNRLHNEGAHIYTTSIKTAAKHEDDGRMWTAYEPLPEGDAEREALQKKQLPSGRKWTFRHRLDGRLARMQTVDSLDYIFFRLKNTQDPDKKSLQQATALALADTYGSDDALLVNDPRATLDFDKVAFHDAMVAAGAEQYMPATHITTDPVEAVDVAQVYAVANPYSVAVIKNSDGFGGTGVRVLTPTTNIEELQVWAAEQTAAGQTLVVQDGCDASKGDKRIIVVSNRGEPEVLGAFKRIPKPGELIANVKNGGSRVDCDTSAHEQNALGRLSEQLFPRGVVWFGGDTLYYSGEEDKGRKVIEANVLAPGGLVLAEGPDMYDPVDRMVELVMEKDLRPAA